MVEYTPKNFISTINAYGMEVIIKRLLLIAVVIIVIIIAWIIFKRLKRKGSVKKRKNN